MVIFPGFCVEPCAAPPVAEEADEEEVSIAPRPVLIDDAVDSEDQTKEDPKVLLGKEQGLLGVVRKYVYDLFAYPAHCSLVLFCWSRYCP